MEAYSISQVHHWTKVIYMMIDQSIQGQTSWMETSVDQLGTTVNQGHVCDTPISPDSDRPHEWKHIITHLGTTVNQSHCVWWVP